MGNFKLYYSLAMAQITSGVVWDFFLVLVVVVALLFWCRHGQRITEGRGRALGGLLFLLTAVILDWTDEWALLNLVPLLGRASVWHEPLEDLSYLGGLVLFVSHWKKLVRYR